MTRLMTRCYASAEGTGPVRSRNRLGQKLLAVGLLTLLAASCGGGGGVGTPIGPVVVDNILFYSRVTGQATIGSVSSDGTYRDLRTHELDTGWDNIVVASHGTLLFYNSRARIGASARIGEDGSFTDLRTMDLDEYWTHIVPLSEGKLLFYNTYTGVAVTGVLSPDGSYRDLHQQGIGPGWDSIAETRSATLLCNRVDNYPSSTTTTFRIGPDGAFTHRAGPQEWPYFARAIPIYADHLLLDNGFFSSLAELNPGSSTDRLLDVLADRSVWAQIVATRNDMLVLYDIWRGELKWGHLIPSTTNSYSFTAVRSQRIDPLWTHVVALR